MHSRIRSPFERRAVDFRGGKLLSAVFVLTSVVVISWGAVPESSATETPHAAGFVATPAWSAILSGANVVWSSPNVANLDGQPRSSWAIATATCTPSTSRTGRPYPGWPFPAGAPVDSTPSVGPDNSVFVGSGNVVSPNTGGYQAIAPNGSDKWFVQESNPATDPTPNSGVAASLTVGNYAGGFGVEAGSLGQNAGRALGLERHAPRWIPVVPG